MSTVPTPEFTFMGSNSRLAQFVARPIRRFLHVEAAGGLLMLAATVGALVWANSPWADGYISFWETPIEVVVGSFQLGGEGHFYLRALVNDGLMAVFFFVVGLEIKRELVTGQLQTLKAASLPAFAALGGMVVPAAIYLAFSWGTAASNGWGVPMATDIAFAVGLISLLGNRVDRKLRVFILSVAIVDDLGAIAVIAIVYTDTIGWGWLGGAGAILAVIVGLRVMRVWYVPLYAVLGLGLWVAMLQSGVHATVAGVLLGFVTPAKPIQSRLQVRKWVDWLREKDDEIMAVDVHYAAFHMKESRSVAERLGIAWHPITSFLIVPVFALANAGVPLGGGVLGDSVASRVTWGVAIGLFVGKAVGITAFTWAATKLRLAALPQGMNMGHVGALAIVSGVGFTVSLFVTSLAFSDAALQSQSKIGILGGSAVAAIVGLAALARVTRPEKQAQTKADDAPAHARIPMTPQPVSV